MIRPFNKGVLVGNWYEDRVLEEDVIKDYLERRNNGELTSQKLAAKMPQPVQLSNIADNRIHIGDALILKCDGASSQNSLIAKANRKDCYLSAGSIDTGSNTTSALGSPNGCLIPNTVLVVRSVDGSLLGKPLKYGQPFALSTFDGSYFLHSDLRSYDRAAKQSRLQLVDFVNTYNHECDWVATCLNPQFRLEAEGSDILAGDKIVILHMKTNKALGIVADFNNPSRFEIVANTFLNSHKAEEDTNHWRFVSNEPKLDIPLR